MTTIFSGTYIEALNIKNLIESNKIEFFFLNETMSIIEPVISSGGFNSAILQVRQADFEKVKKLLQAYENGDLKLK